MERIAIWSFMAYQVLVLLLLATIVYQLTQRPGIKQSEMERIIKGYCTKI